MMRITGAFNGATVEQTVFNYTDLFTTASTQNTTQMHNPQFFAQHPQKYSAVLTHFSTHANSLFNLLISHFYTQSTRLITMTTNLINKEK